MKRVKSLVFSLAVLSTLSSVGYGSDNSSSDIKKYFSYTFANGLKCKTNLQENLTDIKESCECENIDIKAFMLGNLSLRNVLFKNILFDNLPKDESLNSVSLTRSFKIITSGDEDNILIPLSLQTATCSNTYMKEDNYLNPLLLEIEGCTYNKCIYFKNLNK